MCAQLGYPAHFIKLLQVKHLWARLGKRLGKGCHIPAKLIGWTGRRMTGAELSSVQYEVSLRTTLSRFHRASSGLLQAGLVASDLRFRPALQLATLDSRLSTQPRSTAPLQHRMSSS
jgi:hypothetical protein